MPLQDRLLEVIALQNAIADAENDVDEVLSVVVRRAPELTGADAGVVEFPARPTRWSTAQ